MSSEGALHSPVVDLYSRNCEFDQVAFLKMGSAFYLPSNFYGHLTLSESIYPVIQGYSCASSVPQNPLCLNLKPKPLGLLLAQPVTSSWLCSVPLRLLQSVDDATYSADCMESFKMKKKNICPENRTCLNSIPHLAWSPVHQNWE